MQRDRIPPLGNHLLKKIFCDLFCRVGTTFAEGTVPQACNGWTFRPYMEKIHGDR